MRTTRLLLITTILCAAASARAGAQGAAFFDGQGERFTSREASCRGLPTASDLAAALADVSRPGTVYGDAGGLFHGRQMWAAVVNRDGVLCAYATTQGLPGNVPWPGSQAIAKAKAYTANAFSNGAGSSAVIPLSTARLFTFVQPGHSLYGLNQSNPFDPACLAPTSGASGGRGKVCGGIITFGGGVPIYSSDGHILGGIGVSGDTACSDHEIAKRLRDTFDLNPPGSSGHGTQNIQVPDEIVYSIDAPGLQVFRHPACLNTWRNGVNLGISEPGPNQPY